MCASDNNKRKLNTDSRGQESFPLVHGVLLERENAALEQYDVVCKATVFILGDEDFFPGSELAWTPSLFWAPVSLTPCSDLGKHFLLIGARTVLSTWSCDLAAGAVHKKSLSMHKQIRQFAVICKSY